MLFQYPKQKTMYNPELGNPNSSRSNVADRLHQKFHEKQLKLAKAKEIKEQQEIPKAKSFVNNRSKELLKHMPSKSFLERQQQAIEDKKYKQEMYRLLEDQLENIAPPSPIKPSRSCDEFIRQSNIWLEYKNSKIQMLRNEQNDVKSTFKPEINPRSSQIIENKKKRSISPYTKKSTCKDNTKYDFSPKINKRSQEIVNRRRHLNTLLR